MFNAIVRKDKKCHQWTRRKTTENEIHVDAHIA